MNNHNYYIVFPGPCSNYYIEELRSGAQNVAYYIYLASLYHEYYHNDHQSVQKWEDNAKKEFVSNCFVDFIHVNVIKKVYKPKRNYLPCIMSGGPYFHILIVLNIKALSTKTLLMCLDPFGTCIFAVLYYTFVSKPLSIRACTTNLLFWFLILLRGFGDFLVVLICRQTPGQHSSHYYNPVQENIQLSKWRIYHRLVNYAKLPIPISYKFVS